MWALDFQFDEITDRRRLKSLHVVDEHTREALSMRLGTEVRRLSAGEFIVVPAGTIHTFATVNDAPASVLVTMTPQIDALVRAP